eukprot:2206287-Pleurochrysis_carterae.AAC.3
MPSLAHAATLARMHATERRRPQAATLRARSRQSTPTSQPASTRALRQITADMSNADTTDTVSEQSSWDSSQLSQRAGLNDLLPWLPTKNAGLNNLLPWFPTKNTAYASLCEYGYTLTPQGRVVDYSYQHAQA